MKFNALEPNTKQLVIWLVMIHNLFNTIAYPFSGALSNGLRTAGGVKFAMYGGIGIAAAMVNDRIIRAVIFFWRQQSGKWKTFQVI